LGSFNDRFFGFQDFIVHDFHPILELNDEGPDNFNAVYMGGI
jgi:hypothetical protein